LRSVNYFYIFMVILFMKICLSVLVCFIGNDFFGGGNDSNYYDEYAQGSIDVATNIWPVILRWLNNVGLYSREGISHLLKLIGFIGIPFLVAKLTYVKCSPIRNRIFWAAVVVISAYPTLTYYTTDIYRDVFMLFLWVLGLFIFRALSYKPGFLKGLPFFLAGLIMAYVLFEFRPYLGFGYLAALVFSVFYSFSRYPLLVTLLALVGVLFALFAGGFLEPIFAYRAIFSETMTGGANLGITFPSIARFLPDLALTVSYQLFGLFFVNIPSVLVFFLESLPFIVFLRYVVRNRKFSTKFIDYLVVFFVAYSTIWLLGNDNLGTAVRLRMFSYISIFIAFCIIHQNKKILLAKQ
jgi:hypothetical protein